MITENLSTLKIHKLTKDQYDRELSAGRIDRNSLYLIPDESAEIDATLTKSGVAADAKAVGEAIASNALAIELLTNGVSSDEIDSVNDLIQYVKSHGGEITGIKAEIKANADDIDNIRDGDTINSFANVETAISNAIDEIKEYADGQVENVKQVLVTVDQSTGRASMTSSEIFTAMGNGSTVILALEIESRVAFLSIYGWDSRGIWFSLEGWTSEGFGNLVACIDDEGNIYTEQAVIPTLNNLTTAINSHNTDNVSHADIRNAITAKADSEHSHSYNDLTNKPSINGKNLTSNTTLTADDMGIYVQSAEPTNAVEGDIWVDVDAESHLDPEIVIDSTLTKSGQAADAKVVGDAIAAIGNGQNGKDGNGIKSAVVNADYTLTLNFDDGTSYTSQSIRGAAGKDGKTPVKGTDYFTVADKQELVNAVLASLPTWTGGSY